MRFRRPIARSSRVASPTAPSPPRPHPPAPRAVHWRSLWGRVHTRWAATATTTTSAGPPSTLAVGHSQGFSSNGLSTRSSPAPQSGLRAYLHRKRGELWFLTKRRHDGDLHSADDAEEVEVPPPRVDRKGGSSPSVSSTVPHALRSLLSLGAGRVSNTSSELEIDMSSYSASSDGIDESDDGMSNGEHTASDSDAGDDDEQAEIGRDSYATTNSDPFLRRYSSWCSIDDELDHDESRSPTLEELYEVRFVEVGGTPTPLAGIWV